MPKKDNDYARGIHDPFRLGSPEWEPPPDDAPAGTKKSQLPLDWDLQHMQMFTLRQPGVSLGVVGTDTAEGAAARIIQAFEEDHEVRDELRSAGFEHGATKDGTGFVLAADDQALFCPHATSTRDGLYRLCRALRRIIVTSRQRNSLQRWGLVPRLS